MLKNTMPSWINSCISCLMACHLVLRCKSKCCKGGCCDSDCFMEEGSSSDNNILAKNNSKTDLLASTKKKG